jgi:hypothetical protein
LHSLIDSDLRRSWVMGLRSLAQSRHPKQRNHPDASASQPSLTTPEAVIGADSEKKDERADRLLCGLGGRVPARALDAPQKRQGPFGPVSEALGGKRPFSERTRQRNDAPRHWFHRNYGPKGGSRI